MGLSEKTIKTLLFTDMAGSSQLWNKHQAGMMPTLNRHDALLQTAIETCGGAVFKTVGDAFYATFEAPPDALRAAVQAQQALSAASWVDTGAIQVRMGIHTGTVIPRDGDYFGPTLGYVARIMSAAHGGQIVLSEDSAALLADSLPDNITYRPLGSYAFKDFNEPRPIFQVCHPALPSQFPPLQAEPDHNLSLPAVDTLLDRPEQQQEIRTALSGTRLLTVLGGYGLGKTSLALMVARDVFSQFKHGIRFVDLSVLPASASDEQVWETLAAALNVPYQPVETLAQRITEAHARKERLLILDNCEQVIDACRRIVNALLTRTVALKVLATSRVALNLSSETVYPAPSLAVPARDTASVETLQQNEAARILLHYAARQGRRFSLSKANYRDIAQVCIDLDGNALALSIVGARLGSNPAYLSTLTDLKTQIDAVRTPDHDRSARQASLDGAIRWSYDLLSSEAQSLLCRLSILSGEWSIDAAEALCARSRLSSAVGDLVEHLVENSLITQDQAYRIPRPIRQFAEKRLKSNEKKKLHALAAQHYAEELTGYLDTRDDTSSLMRFFLFDDPRWLAKRQEWLHHISFADQREIARQQCAFMFFNAFWWWDEYTEFPFCGEILSRWETTQNGADDQALAASLRRFRDLYPRKQEWQARIGKPAWRQVESTLKQIHRNMRIDRRRMLEKTRNRLAQTAVSALIAVYRAEAFHLGPASLRNYRKAERLYRLAAHLFASQDDYQWSESYALFALAELYGDRKEYARALIVCREALEKRCRSEEDLPYGTHYSTLPLAKRMMTGGDDFEVQAHLFRVAADSCWMAATSEETPFLPAATLFDSAWKLYTLALWNAYLFHRDPHLPDQYTKLLYGEILARILLRLREASAEGIAGVVDAAHALHAFWPDAEPRASDTDVSGWIRRIEHEEQLSQYLCPRPPDIETEEARARYGDAVLQTLSVMPKKSITLLMDAFADVCEGAEKYLSAPGKAKEN